MKSIFLESNTSRTMYFYRKKKQNRPKQMIIDHRIAHLLDISNGNMDYYNDFLKKNIEKFLTTKAVRNIRKPNRNSC